jgi:hypothetical protein
MPEIKPVENEVNIPEIEVKLPPEIAKQIPPPPEEVSITAIVLKERDKLKNNWIIQWHNNAMAWLIIPIGLGVTDMVFFTVQVITVPIDALFNAMLATVYDIFMAWYNFINTVNEHYHGNWGQAIIDITLRVLLLEALDEAMNIPAVKQTVDIIISTVKQVRSAFSNLRDQLNLAFSDTFHIIGQYFKDNNDLLAYLFKDELSFWSNSITTFVSSIQSSLTKSINNLETKYLADIYRISDELEKIKKEIEKYNKEFKDKVIATVKGDIQHTLAQSPLMWGPPEIYKWLRERWQNINQLNYAYYDAVNKLYEEHKIKQEYDLSAIYREMMDELLDDNSEMNKYQDKLIEEVEDLDQWLEAGNTVKWVRDKEKFIVVKEKKQ